MSHDLNVSTAKEPIDSGLLLYFQKPKSFTGEDMLEFHIHGGLAVKSRMLTALSKFETFREAQPVSYLTLY